MSALEFILLIFVIGVVFMLNQPSIDKDKLRKVLKSIDKELSHEFKKRDNKIEELEKRLKIIENEIAKERLGE